MSNENKELEKKETCIRIRMTWEQKERLDEYAKAHFQTKTGVIEQALALLYERDASKEQQLFLDHSIRKTIKKIFYDLIIEKL